MSPFIQCVIMMGGSSAGDAARAASGLNFAIAGYAIGLGLLLGYGMLLWRRSAGLRRQGVSAPEDAGRDVRARGR